MKNISNFELTSQYNQAQLERPHVSLTQDNYEIHYDPSPFNGHEHVDLGLPSGTLWATMNVGANSSTECGNYYMYGIGDQIYENNNIQSYEPYLGTENPLDLSVDTARQVWGGQWHTPTKTQMEELITNTTYQWIENYQSSGISGGLFTAQNGNSIFLPACGMMFGENYYPNVVALWSSTPFDETSVYGIQISTNTQPGVYDDGVRNIGVGVRGVIG